MSLFAYNKTTGALNLGPGIFTLPAMTAAAAAGSRGRAFDVIAHVRCTIPLCVGARDDPVLLRDDPDYLRRCRQRLRRLLCLRVADQLDQGLLEAAEGVRRKRGRGSRAQNRAPFGSY